MNRGALLALYLLNEEEDDAIVRISISNVQRRPQHIMFRQRNTEGTYKNLICKYLVDDEEKFQQFFRLTKEQFHFVLSAIKPDIEKAPTNIIQRPITAEEKLGVTLR